MINIRDFTPTSCWDAGVGKNLLRSRDAGDAELAGGSALEVPQ